jgi:hypothetical protein
VRGAGEKYIIPVGLAREEADTGLEGDHPTKQRFPIGW